MSKYNVVCYELREYFVIMDMTNQEYFNMGGWTWKNNIYLLMVKW